jgi:hypothetical protein
MRRSLISICVLFSGLLLTCGANAQIRDDRLLNDIADGGTDELLLALARGIPADEEVFVPGSDLAVSLLAHSVYAANDDAAMELLAAGARLESLDGQFNNFPIIEVLAQQGMLRTLGAYLDLNPGALVGVGPGLLHTAVLYGQPGAARRLLERMSTVVSDDELRGSMEEAIVVAARMNDAVATELLLEWGADPSGSPSGSPLIAAVLFCAPDTAGQILARVTGPLPTHEGEPVAFYARRCFEMDAHVEAREGDEDADSSYSRIVELLYEADSSICPVLTGVRGDEALRVSRVLADLDLCQ